jgi:hypothetical protein
VHRILRVAVAAVDATRLTEQQCAFGVVIRDRGGRDGDLRQLVAQPERIQLADGVRQQVDPHAQRPQVRGAFENGRPDAACVQRQCGGQPANATTCNQYVSHVVSFPRYPGLASTSYKSNIDMSQKL